MLVSKIIELKYEMNKVANKRSRKRAQKKTSIGRNRVAYSLIHQHQQQNLRGKTRKQINKQIRLGPKSSEGPRMSEWRLELSPMIRATRGSSLMIVGLLDPHPPPPPTQFFLPPLALFPSLVFVPSVCLFVCPSVRC